jgi:membrane protease YdiL (CAAX protease family)
LSDFIDPSFEPVLPPPPPPAAEPGIALQISSAAVWKLAAGTLFVVVLIFLVGQTLQLINLPFGLAMTSLFIFGAAGLVCPAAFNLRPGAFTGITRRPGGLVIVAVFIGLVNLPLANYMMGVCHELLPKSWSEQDDLMTELFSEADRPARIILAVAASVAAPIGEELFFRGWLQRLLAQRYSTAVSIVTAATLFSLAHFDVIGFPARVELGILFGLVRVWSGSLWPSIALHGTHNLVSMGSFFLQDDSEKDEPFQWGIATALALGSLVLVWLCLLLFRWWSRDRHDPEQRNVPDAERVPLRFTPLRAASLAGPISLGFAVSLVLLLAFHSRLPGANLTKAILPQQLGGESSPAPPDTPHAQDGGSHAE